MDLGLSGKVVLVSASSGGIGLSTAECFAREGARVVVNGRTEQTTGAGIEELRRRLPGGTFLPLAADLGTREGCDQAIAAFPDVDILVNNLGIYGARDFFAITDEEWLEMVEVNVMSGVRLSRHYLKRMLERNSGRIIFVSTESAINPDPEMAHYSASKTMQLAISRNLAELTKGTGVTVNAVLPGPVRSPGVEKLVVDIFKTDLATAEKRFMAENRSHSLIQRLTEPREIGDVIAFVASDLASAINGAAVRADGGMVRSVF
ncbi:SDR family oxidoreductase [Chelativorans sp.]|uniref:SDR family NAD(P)-dependent oxidoreductase n=1 Tax=Chelativorans sp. TaxID=2203393 RepID=UPI0028123C6A|nr:SDR family oxidoreductase [Chelativorans sp.]